MTPELKEYVSKCDICLAHRASTSKEPLLQHEFVGRLRSKIGADLCELQEHIHYWWCVIISAIL